MRLVHAALLAAVPAVAFGARVVQQSAADAPPPPPPPPALADVASADAVSVRGDRSRARVFSMALADIDAEVLLGEAACTEEVTASAPQTARYAAGSRRYENPEYAALTATKAEHSQAISALAAEQATLRASLQVHAERAALQDDRIALARREQRVAQAALDDASAAMSEAQTRLSRASAAAGAIEDHSLRRSQLEDQIRDLRRSVAALEGQVAEAAAARDTQARAAGELAAAEARLAGAAAVAQDSRAALRAARDRPDLTEAERAAIRAQARAARADLEAAEEAAEAARRIAARADDHGGHLLGRSLRQQQAALAAAEEARATLQPPSGHHHELAASVPKLERRVRREASQVARAEHALVEAGQHLRAQQAHADALAAERADREAALAEQIAQEEGLRAALLSTEAAMAAVAPMRSRTLWEEVRYTVETRTRTCAVDATLLWPDGTFTQARAAASDTDTMHDASAVAGIAADALEYGRTDRARVAAADQDLIAQLRAAADGAVADAVDADTGW